MRDLPPLRLSAELTKVAQHRANEIGNSGRLDFELPSAGKTQREAKALGYSSWWVQEFDAVGVETAAEFIEQCRQRVENADVYLRHEARDVGIGQGRVGDQPLVVAILAVPPSLDPLRKRDPGVAPREWLIADLTKRLNERRTGLGLGFIERTSDLDRIAQASSARILEATGLDGAGTMAMEGSRGVALYYKGKALNVSTPGLAVRTWFEMFRLPLTRRGTLEAGMGLSSRERAGRLEAVWVVVLPSSEKP